MKSLRAFLYDNYISQMLKTAVKAKYFPFILSCRLTRFRNIPPGIFPSPFLQLVNGSKNSIVNRVLKLIYSCFFFSFLFLKNPWKIFFSVHLFFLLFGYTHKIKMYSMFLSSQLFFKTLNKTLKSQKKSRKNALYSDLQT